MKDSLIAFKGGFTAFMEGLRWYRSHPFYAALIALPLVVAVVFVITLLGLFIEHREELMRSLFFDQPEFGGKLFLWWVLYISSSLAAVFFVFFTGPIVADLLSTPIYELVSARIERDFCSQPPREIQFWASVRLLREEFKKALAILGLSAIVIPVPILNFLVPPFLIACDMYDYSMARRGFSFRRRVSFVLQDVWAVIGFALWFTIPFLQFLIMPLAVAGGTILASRKLEKLDLGSYPLT